MRWEEMEELGWRRKGRKGEKKGTKRRSEKTPGVGGCMETSLHLPNRELSVLWGNQYEYYSLWWTHWMWGFMINSHFRLTTSFVIFIFSNIQFLSRYFSNTVFSYLSDLSRVALHLHRPFTINVCVRRHILRTHSLSPVRRHILRTHPLSLQWGVTFFAHTFTLST